MEREKVQWLNNNINSNNSNTQNNQHEHDSSFSKWRLPASTTTTITNNLASNFEAKQKRTKMNTLKDPLQRRCYRNGIHKPRAHKVMPSRIPIKSTRIKARKQVAKALDDLADAITHVGLSSGSKATTHSPNNNNDTTSFKTSTISNNACFMETKQ